jgi:hypothetical protein
VRDGAYSGQPRSELQHRRRSSIAFIVDVRRDNLLLHLLFKALFRLSRTRIEVHRAAISRHPSDIDAWRTAPVDRLIAYVDGAAAVPAGVERAGVDDAIVRMGVPLSPEDRATIDRSTAGSSPTACRSGLRAPGVRPRATIRPTATFCVTPTSPAARPVTWRQRRRSSS